MRTTQKGSVKKKASQSSRLHQQSGVAASGHTLHHQAFENSLQANIITTASTGKITEVNKAACKLLNYSKKELLTKSRSDIFDIAESSFKKLLKERTADGKSIAKLTVLKKNGKSITCEVTSAVFLDEKGIQKAITTIADMSHIIMEQKNIDKGKEKIVADNIILVKSNQKRIDDKKEKIVANDILLATEKSDARVMEFNELLRHIGKTSYDVMWDWDIASGDIYVGDSSQEVFGYKVQNNTIHFSDFTGCLPDQEKRNVEKKLSETLASKRKSWSDSYIIKRQDGSLAATTSRASIIRDEKGKAIHLIGATQDISRLEELKKLLAEQTATKTERGEFYSQTAKLSFDGIWDWNILTNEFFLGEGFEELFGYPFTNTDDKTFDWSKHLHPDDKKAVEESLQEAIRSSAVSWEQAYRFIKADGSIANVFGRASIIRNADGKACRMIGIIHDFSRQQELEETLKLEIKLKERQIAEAMQEAKDSERSEIGRELHDNINQLLGASKLYLDMAKRGGEHAESHLSRSSEYTVTAIEEIRKLTKGLTTDIIINAGLYEAIYRISRDTMETSPVKIVVSLKGFIEESVNTKFKLNIYRIIQEQLNNILKHAQATEVKISLSQNKETIVLSIADNGIGFDTSKKRKGIGIDNIKSRAISYDGIADFISQPGEGCTLIVTFSVTYPLPE